MFLQQLSELNILVDCLNKFKNVKSIKKLFKNKKMKKKIKIARSSIFD